MCSVESYSTSGKPVLVSRQSSCVRCTPPFLAHTTLRPLTCATAGFDRYRRVLAVCALPDGSDVNAWMVQQGWALAYYSDAYRPQEAEAQAAKRGIGAGTFIPPWVWRHRHLHS